MNLRTPHIVSVEPPHPNRRKWLYASLALLVLAGVAGAFLARPAYHGFKRWRALQFTEASVQAMRANDLQTAIDKAQAALRLWPFDPQVARQMAIVVTAVDPAHAPPYWFQTWALSHDVADLRKVIETSLAIGDVPFAANQYGLLEKLDPNNPLTWYTQAQVRVAQNQWREALELLKHVFDSGKAPEDAYLLYAQAAEMAPDPAIRDTGLAQLRLLAKRTDLLGLRARRALAFYPGQTPIDLQNDAKLLEGHPLATVQDKLLGLSILARLPGADENSLLQAAQELFLPGDKNGLVEVGRWLIQQGRYEAALRLIDSDTAMKRQDLFLIRLDAMAGLNQWAAIDSILGQKNIPIPEELRLLFEARALTELGATTRANVAWDTIRLAVANQPAKLRTVAEYAMKLRLYNYARPALDLLVQSPEERFWAYQQLFQLERNLRNTEGIEKVLTEMAKKFSADPAVRNDLLYTGFLLGHTGPDEIAAAQKLRNDHPQMLSYRVTLALGLLKTGHGPEALQQFADVPGDSWPSVFFPWRAVRVGVLRANGQLLEANALEKTIPAGALLPEEAALLNIPLPKPAGA